MIVPTMPIGPAIDVEGNWTEAYQLYWEQLRQLMQQSLSNDGFVPPTRTPTDIAQIAPTASNSALVFDATIVNGGTSDEPNGQLLIRLADGTFHPIVNS